MRVNWQAKTRTQFESSLPKWTIEPVSVEVKQNDTVVEGFPVFEKLVKLATADRNVDDVLSDLGVEKITTQSGEELYWDRADNAMLDWFDLCYRFLCRNYRRRWAYVKVGDKEIYWQIEVNSRRFHMKTSEWLLTMPAVFVMDTLSGENKYVFFPMSAILSDSEQWLFELYRNVWTTDDTAAIEREIMRQLEKLSVARQQKITIAESNNQLNEIEQMCKDSWVIRKLSCYEWRLVLDFDWRTVMDSDWEYRKMVLPPLKLYIDLRNFTVRADRCYHPHVLGDYWLCMGGRLTDLVQKCINERDLKTLVGGMIDFGNSWTSSDAGDSDRHPAECIIRYKNDEPVDRATIPVKPEDILETMECRGYDKHDLWNSFAALFDNE